MSRLSVLTKRPHEVETSELNVPPLPQPISPWQVHPTREMTKRLFLARQRLMQMRQARPLRRNPVVISVATDRELPPVDGYKSETTSQEASVQQQVNSHSRHLDRGQLTQDHHDFSHRMRSR